MISDIQSEILKLKKEKGVTIFAHTYQSHDITEIADVVGDSFLLSRKAAEDKNPVAVVCGVHFMAETVKMLSPEKKVILANGSAGCPMAEQFTADEILAMKKQYDDCAVVSYINTTAEIKTVSDVCVTSSSVLEICKKIDNKNILFVPDCNLGGYVSKNIPDKNFILINGGCPVHSAVEEKEVITAKKLHPNALFLVHPECKPEVVKYADYIGSTSGIIDFAKKSDKKEFIIGTENSVLAHLQFECPDKTFYPLSKNLICPHMKAT
ncbi:MAG: quinolinate synthase NadA, partial [Oscillospiraceae bacterium]